jgi:hypothetical protein
MIPDWSFHCAEFADGKAGLGLEAKLGAWPMDWREAAALYRRFGVRTLGDLVSCLLREIEPLKAMRGDVVMVDGALGVCRGEWAEFMDMMQPMSKVTRAWSADTALHLGSGLAAHGAVNGLNGGASVAS